MNTTPTTSAITDNDAPTIINDTSDTLATTGETFNFSVNATDNINMSEVHVVWWFGAGAPTNDTMTGTGPYTFSIPVPPDSLDQLHYYFTMNDTADNWLVGPQVDVDVTDNDAPTYNWILQPTVGAAGTSVNVSLQAFDNIGITNYTIYVNGTPYVMDKDGDDDNYTINIPPGSTADITYNVTFGDAAGNTIETGDTTIAVVLVDTEAPVLTWVSQPTAGTT